MEYLLSIVIALVGAISMGQLYDAFMQRKRLKIPYALYIIFYTLVETSFLFVSNLQPFGKYGIDVLFGFSFAILLYGGKILGKLFAAVIFFSFAALLDIAVALIFSTIAGSSIKQLQSGHLSFIFGAGTYSLLLLIITLIIKQVAHSRAKGYMLTYKEWACLLIFPAISILLIITIYEDSQRIHATTPLMLFSVVGLLAANVALLFLVDALEQEQKSKEDKRLLEHQIKLEMGNVEELVELNTAQRRQSHDYENKLNALGSLLANNEYKAAEEYTSQLCREFQAIQYVVHSNNPLVDAVLNAKYLVARKNQILMRFDINDLSDFLLRNEELVTVLANLLDNSIDACLKVPAKPEICVKIHHDEDGSMISVMNTVNGPIEITDNMVKSTKGSNRHGYGLANIKFVLDKYGYGYVIDCKNGWFQFTTIMT